MPFPTCLLAYPTPLYHIAVHSRCPYRHAGIRRICFVTGSGSAAKFRQHFSDWLLSGRGRFCISSDAKSQVDAVSCRVMRHKAMQAMPCDGCQAVLCNVMPCHAIPCRVIPCRAICHSPPPCITPRRNETAPHRTAPHRNATQRNAPKRIAPHCIAPHRTASQCTTTHHIVL